MPFPPQEKVPDQDFSRVLDTLASLISQLPSEVPLTSEADTCFKEFLPPFRLDPDYFAKTEDEIATLGEQLERVFGFNTRSSGDGVLTIEERGPGLSAMHDVLVEYYHKYPSNMVHKKWIIDIANAVEQVYVHNNVPVPTRQMVEKRKELDDVDSEVEILAPATKKVKQPHPGGAPENPLLARLITKHVREQGKRYFSCVACSMQRKGNASLDRAVKHALKCKKLEKYDKQLLLDVKAYAGESSLGAQLEDLEETEFGETINGRKKTGLDVAQLRAVGKQKEKKNWEIFQSRVDHAIMRLICVRGLVPNVIDSPEWKDLFALLNNNIRPTSSSTFADKIIPQEAAFVRERMVKLLRDSNNLTLSFDGSSTRHPESFYTTHITTPERVAYFLDGLEWRRGIFGFSPTPSCFVAGLRRAITFSFARVQYDQ
ncbi:hypothetical protein AGABI1DRAFT_128748 [Agaricus bisporus var. burnettii JB137-S8]|uniref:DUF659 domain-containing protein n=1 Tax=Agaricus bisporus var. burnettii (strain JB137-S8 / ATCC MYA-4627 / FGSC 10392) TaxID=597362 RepID=K5VYR1_AGABU|nr:uncharacterized protein AGABI1DRAFT_128748 [Agaricus bisporus var. burnettii JB137-S8]EKM79604.1 hypothetical protein AGABI1DRAFT_128748 [Agaricus bisporus var. burnettii JB137-S8]